jgi:hypothetical protein
MKNTKAAEVMGDIPERKAEMRLTIPPEKKSLTSTINGLKIGKRATFTITGKIVSLSMDRYDSSVRIEVSALDCDPGLGGQVEDLRNSRKGY